MKKEMTIRRSERRRQYIKPENTIVKIGTTPLLADSGEDEDEIQLNILHDSLSDIDEL